MKGNRKLFLDCTEEPEAMVLSSYLLPDSCNKNKEEVGTLRTKAPAFGIEMDGFSLSDQKSMFRYCLRHHHHRLGEVMVERGRIINER